jgi:hypothetical protein
MSAEAFIKANLDGRFWWVDDFGTVRVKSVAHDFIPSHNRANGIPSTDTLTKHRNPGGRTQRPWTPEEDEKLFAMRHSRKGWDEVRAAIKRCVKACRARYQEICEAKGVEPIPQYPQEGRITVEQQREVLRLIGVGYTMNEVSERTGFSYARVYDVVRRSRIGDREEAA